VTSHALLTRGGLIHVVHADHHSGDDRDHHAQDISHHHHDNDDDAEGSHEHNGGNHAFADGGYRSTSGSKLVLKSTLSVTIGVLASVASFIEPREIPVCSPGPAPPGSRPQILQQTWQFLDRAAIPGRAPSQLS
jgi:hypothetical protein